MIQGYSDYRAYLKSYIGSKRNKSSKSIRGFAKNLGISNSYLSEVLNRRKNLSTRLAVKIASRLNLTELETKCFSLLVQVDETNDSHLRQELLQRLNEIAQKPEVHDLSADLFRTISDWYHFAILELSFLPDFKFTSEFISRRLQISQWQARLAKDRLLRLGLMSRLSNGTFQKTHKLVYTVSPTRSAALRQFHSEVLEKARESLTAQAPSRRISSSEFIPMDSHFLPEIDRLSQEFSTAVLKYSEKSKLKDTVYGLAVHFFPVSAEKGDL